MFVVSAFVCIIALSVVVDGERHCFDIECNGNGMTEEEAKGYFNLDPPIRRKAPPVAFMARQTNATLAIAGAILNFDDIVTNVGDHFKKNSGVFIVPFNGTYMFHLGTGFDNIVSLAMVCNDEPVGVVDDNLKSTTGVVNLKKGDTVFVKIIDVPETPEALPCRIYEWSVAALDVNE